MLVPILAKAQTINCKVNGLLPDSTCTPGDVRKETTIKDICTPNFTKTIRNVPESLKKQVYAEYGMNSKQKPCPCEVDHFISLTLGGSNDIKNLWPESYQNPMGAREKDKLENYYHRQICAGKITQEQVIKELREDWTKYYSKYNLGNKGNMEDNDE